jgi:hypothetical protein
MVISIDTPQLKQIVAEYMAFRMGVDPQQVTVKFDVREHKINTKISVPDKRHP